MITHVKYSGVVFLEEQCLKLNSTLSKMNETKLYKIKANGVNSSFHCALPHGAAILDCNLRVI